MVDPGRDMTNGIRANPWPEVCRLGRRAPKDGGLGVILKCIFSSLPSTKLFGSSLDSGSVRTPKLSEKEARALPGWVTHWEVACEFLKIKP
ncbi:hypothetical protein DVH24_001630 [Malus domestica]|uniref:Uncharacterized protein n=1 Tax=Malus domestica TaxID=3750 RepID=A0A498I3M0_MALDO|nr:hypothetical protein DVH24_001630 [Malus domestica]